MMDIPEDLTGLKRLALQKLCKKLGVRANGKNTEMIAALDAIRTNKLEASEPEPSLEEVPTDVSEKREDEESQQVAMPTSAEEATPTSGVQETVAEEVGMERKRSVTASVPKIASTENMNEDRLDTSVDSRMSRKRRRHSSLAAVHAVSCDMKKAKLDTPTSSIGRDSISNIEESLTLPDEDIHGDKSHSLPDEEGGKRLEEMAGMISCEADTLCGSMNTPDQTERRGEPRPPFSPPSGTRRSSQRKRKRNATYSKDGSERQEDSTGEKRQRRSTYEVSPSNSFILAAKVRNYPSDGPCDSTVALGDRKDMPTESGIKSDLTAMETNPSTVPTVPSLADEKNDKSISLKEEMMSLLEKRVTDRKADPNYVPVHEGVESHIPVKSHVKSKFDKAHKTTFSKMKSISKCYEEGVIRQKSLGDGSHKRPATPRVSMTRNQHRVSLTSKARAKMHSVTPSKPLKRLASGPMSARKHWEETGKTSSATGGMFRPSVTSTTNASYNFPSTNKTVKFDGTLKTKNSSLAGAKRPSAAPGINRKIVKKENSPVHPAVKGKQAFNLEASLKRKKPSYKPYSGKLPPVSQK